MAQSSKPDFSLLAEATKSNLGQTQAPWIAVFVFILATSFLVFALAAFRWPLFVIAGALMMTSILLIIIALTKAAKLQKQRSLELLDQFLSENKLSAAQALPTADFANHLFNIGDSHGQSLSFSGTLHDLPYTITALSFVTGSGKSRRTHKYTVLNLRLPKRLQHLLLDSRRNDRGWMSNLQEYIDNEQRLELEGHFNEEFDLYAPTGYSTAALDILSPDVMDTLIKFHTPFEVEVIGDQVYINAPGDLYSNTTAMDELYLAGDTLAKHFKHKMRSWSFSFDNKQPPALNVAAGEGVIRLGQWRVTTAILTIPLVLLYLFVYAGRWLTLSSAIMYALIITVVVLALRSAKIKRQQRRAEKAWHK